MEDKQFCRECEGLRNHKVLFEEKLKGDDAGGSFQWIDEYKTIQCLGCETISFLHVYGDTEMMRQGENGYGEYYYDEAVFPYHLKKGKELNFQYHIPEKIRLIYRETIAAFKSNSKILTAGGLRAIIEAICNNLKIKETALDDRIDLLHKKGHLTLSESKRLHTIRFLGNDALHEITPPKEEHLYLLLEIVNHLIANLYINDKKLKSKVETVIDEFDEFLLLIQKKITKEMVGKEFSLGKILDKSIRLVSKSKMSSFKKKLKIEIESKEITFLTVRTEGDTTFYKIIKKPKLSFDWF